MAETTTTTTSNGGNDLFRPLSVLQTLERTWHVFRQEWKLLLLHSSIPLFIWYGIAIGIRYVFDKWSLQNVELQTLTVGEYTYGFEWQTYRTTFSRLGLCTEMVLLFLLHAPADAANIRLIATNYYAAGNNTWRDSLRSVWTSIVPKLLHVLLACLVCVIVLAIPALGLIALMAPEGPESLSGMEIYYKPYLSKLLGGGLYFLFSTAILMLWYFCYAAIVVPKQGSTATSGVASLKQSYRMMTTTSQKGGTTSTSYWKHALAVLTIWFLLKILLTKFVTALNTLYYLKDPRFWTVWDENGIPLHPARIFWSSTYDLWQVGRSWISVPFCIILAAMGSVFQAVLYMDARVKQEENYTQEVLCNELNNQNNNDNDDDDVAAYTTMEEQEKKSTAPEEPSSSATNLV